MPGAQRTAVGITGNPGPLEPAEFESLPGVAEAIRVSKPYKLVSREVKSEDSLIHVGPGGSGAGVTIGGRELAIIAGPCAVESREQAFAAARRVREAGARLFRGGAFKPRTSPYSFQGLGEEGLKILAEVRREFGLLIVTETIDPENCDLVERIRRRAADRRAQHAELLPAQARGALAQARAAQARHVRHAGRIPDGRGVHPVRGQLQRHPLRARRAHLRRPHAQHAGPERDSRAVKRLSHLPIIVDPSHGTGKRDKVMPLARAAVAVGADGLIIEVHPQPDRALSDGYQSLFPDQFESLMEQVTAIAGVVGRTTAHTSQHPPEAAPATRATPQ